MTRLVGGLGREAQVAMLLIAAAFFVVRSSVVFPIGDAVLVAALAAASTLPFGWVAVALLTPRIASGSGRLALVVVTGYALSMLVGYFLGYIGVQGLYLPLAVGSGLVALLTEYYKARRRPGGLAAGLAALQGLGQAQSVWVVVIITALSVIAITPLLAPIVRVTPDLYMDYTRIDSYYHMVRAQVLSFGAPAAVWPDLAGVRPLVYPDFNHFWIGQLTRWSGASVHDVYFVYYPIWLVAATTVTMYATGKALTGAASGGYLAAALAFLVLVPNPYDTNLLLRNVDNVSVELTAARLHFVALRSNLSFGAGALLMTGLTFCIATLAHVRTHRLAVGLLVLGSVMAVVLLRVRSHFFVVTLPPFALLLFGLWLFRRRWMYGLPLVVLTGLTLLLYWESSGPHFDPGTSQIAVVYGPYGEAARQALPAAVKALIGWLPAVAEPFASVASLVALRYIGFYFGLVLIGWLVVSVWRRRRPRLVEVFLVGVIGASVAAASMIVLEAWSDTTGNWGAQALYAIPAMATLLALRPLWQIVRAGLARLPGLNREALAAGGLLIAMLVSYRGADSNMHDQTNRAYPLSAQELDAYYWIAHNTPGLAVVAADPAHRVNAAGETIESTNFLGGQTQRPVYIQRVVPFNEGETEARRQLLNNLLDATTPTAAQALVAQATFDYLVVYPDRPAAIDLTCCLELVFAGPVQVYRVRQP